MNLSASPEADVKIAAVYQMVVVVEGAPTVAAEAIVAEAEARAAVAGARAAVTGTRAAVAGASFAALTLASVAPVTVDSEPNYSLLPRSSHFQLCGTFSRDAGLDSVGMSNCTDVHYLLV